MTAGLAAAVDMIDNTAHFVSANDDDSIIYYAQCISRTGSYLSEMAGIPEGTALAYLIAPPLEALYGVDAALKAADVSMCVLYSPPSETNFGGALLSYINGTMPWEDVVKICQDSWTTEAEIAGVVVEVRFIVSHKLTGGVET